MAGDRGEREKGGKGQALSQSILFFFRGDEGGGRGNCQPFSFRVGKEKGKVGQLSGRLFSFLPKGRGR